MATTTARSPKRTTWATPPKAPAFILGLGLGGFVDGIVLHQVLQWHHMLTATGDHPMTTVAGLEANTLADGFFHLATWVLVATAMLLTVRAWQRRELAPPWHRHFGMLLAGWGVFNLAEGLIDHEVLGIHHVRDERRARRELLRVRDRAGATADLMPFCVCISRGADATALARRSRLAEPGSKIRGIYQRQCARSVALHGKQHSRARQPGGLLMTGGARLSR